MALLGCRKNLRNSTAAHKNPRHARSNVQALTARLHVGVIAGPSSFEAPHRRCVPWLDRPCTFMGKLTPTNMIFQPACSKPAWLSGQVRVGRPRCSSTARIALSPVTHLAQACCTFVPMQTHDSGSSLPEPTNLIVASSITTNVLGVPRIEILLNACSCSGRLHMMHPTYSKAVR